MVWEVIGGLAGAAASLFGNDDEPQEQTTSVNYKQMVKAAQKAGINPLTALRNGGAAGFTTTTMPALSSQSTASRIADGVGALANGISAQVNFDDQMQRRGLENQMIQAQIDTLRGRSGVGASTLPAPASPAPSRHGSIPRAPAGTPVRKVEPTLAPVPKQTPFNPQSPMEERRSGPQTEWDRPRTQEFVERWNQPSTPVDPEGTVEPGYKIVEDSKGNRIEIGNPDSPSEAETLLTWWAITGQLVEKANKYTKMYTGRDLVPTLDNGDIYETEGGFILPNMMGGKTLGIDPSNVWWTKPGFREWHSPETGGQFQPQFPTQDPHRR